MEIIVSGNPHQSVHPGIGINGSYNNEKKRFEVYESDPENPKRERIRFFTDHDKEYLVSTSKTRDMGAPPVIVPVNEYERNKGRDMMIILKELPIRNIREKGWRPKAMINVSIPDNVYNIEPEKNIEPASVQPGRAKKQ